MTAKEIQSYLINLGDRNIAEHSQRFFKTGPGEYGEGDCFLGIRVPVLRQAARKFKEADLSVAESLLASEYHEIRLFALIFMVNCFNSKRRSEQGQVYNLFLRKMERVNNWDLVDTSAPYISGPWLYERDCSVLYEWMKSTNLWIRRIAIMSAFYFIRQKRYSETLDLCEFLIHDPEDLIHKAAGWMLREVGNRNKNVEIRFLQQHCQKMPRTMLRYAIEKFPPHERKAWMAGSAPA